jgi:hypothetical protein
VRSIVAVGLAAACLCLAGCLGPGKQGPAAAPTGAPKPFLPRADAEASASAPSSKVNGILAGQVMDKFKRRLPDVYIQVVDLEDLQKPPKARLDVPAFKDGYFTIEGLKPGHTYQLIARVKEGDKTLSGVALATPPNARLTIYLSEDFTTPTTPPAPDPPAPPEKPSDKPPAAKLQPPSKTGPRPDGDGPPAPADTIPWPQVADQKGGKGPEFEKMPPSSGVPRIRRDEVGNIASPPSEEPRVLPPTPAPAPPRPAPAADPEPPTVKPAPPAASALPRASVAAPSAVLVGEQLHTLALKDLATGQTWEYSRNKAGKAVLFVFWRSDDEVSLAWIDNTLKLHKDFGPSGLEVVGVAYEQGAMPPQAASVRAAKLRYGIKYRLLLGGGAPETCPVAKEFLIDRFPTLVLLDEKGKIAWRSREGMDAPQLRELRHEIGQLLGIKGE